MIMAAMKQGEGIKLDADSTTIIWEDRAIARKVQGVVFAMKG
jgi:hypothetical protein